MQKISMWLILIAVSSWADDADRWTPAEMMKGRTIGVVAPSPDGKRVAWSESRAVMTEDLSVYQDILFRANTDGSDRRRMTFGRYSAVNPRWSPDGKWIAFTHTAPDAKTQLAIMRGDGGGLLLLTQVKTDVGDFRWAPDSSELAFLSVDAPSEEEEKKTKAKDDAVTVDHDHKYQHLWRVAIPGDNEEPESNRITEGELQVNSGFDWSPDGSRIVFSHNTEPGANAWPSSDISIVDVETGVVIELRATAAAEGTPVFSADGNKIAFVTTADPPSWMREAYVAIMDVEGANVDEEGSLLRASTHPWELQRFGNKVLKKVMLSCYPRCPLTSQSRHRQSGKASVSHDHATDRAGTPQ